MSERSTTGGTASHRCLVWSRVAYPAALGSLDTLAEE